MDRWKEGREERMKEERGLESKLEAQVSQWVAGRSTRSPRGCLGQDRSPSGSHPRGDPLSKAAGLSYLWREGLS